MTEDQNTTRSPKYAPRAKVMLVNPGDSELCCGPGMCRLLGAIAKSGTVRGACEEMNMSYSKGWKLLRRLEKWLGCKVTVRQRGGKGGGNASLTPEGSGFLEKYQAFEQDCQRAIKEVFKHYYGELS